MNVLIARFMSNLDKGVKWNELIQKYTNDELLRNFGRITVLPKNDKKNCLISILAESY